jgi:hypothetical protein
VRARDWKLVCEKGRIGLFDLGRDISEKNDLAKTMPEKVAELTRLHDAWLAEMKPPITGEGKRFGQPGAGENAKPRKSDRKKKDRAAK